MNLNTLFDRLTNFKIKFTENPSPVEVSNLPLIFMIGDYQQYEFKSIKMDFIDEVVIMTLE